MSLRFRRTLRGQAPTEQATPHDVRVREQLDGLVVNTELTMISIIQGVALYFLVESSRGLIVGMRVAYWPYIALGLITIFVFWSRSLIHTFTVIRWPLEFGHNFIYIACTFVQAVMFTQIANLENWFLLGTVYSMVVWFLFLFDFEMIVRLRDEQVEGKEAFCDVLEADQLFNLRFLMPSLIVFHAGAWIAVRNWPDVFLAGSWHILLGCMQLAGGLVYLALVLRFFGRLAPMIVRQRE